MDECVGIIGTILGHKYEPRYDVIRSNNGIDLENIDVVLDNAYIEVVESMVNKNSVYVKDVCIRCGKTINRNEETND